MNKYEKQLNNWYRQRTQL